MKGRELDQALMILDAIVPPGCTLTQKEIADIIGCTHQMISYIEKQGIKHLRQEAKSRPWMLEAFEEIEERDTMTGTWSEMDDEWVRRTAKKCGGVCAECGKPIPQWSEYYTMHDGSRMYHDDCRR